MKIESVRIQNFRSFKDETIFFDDYTCLVGPNGGGKSTVLCALNVFFRETENSATDVLNLSIEDFHQKKAEDPIKITVTFVDLNEEAQADFKDYYRQGKLIVSAVAELNSASGTAQVHQSGERLGMNEFRPFFEALDDGKVVAELKKIFGTLRQKYPKIDAATTKDGMTEALRGFESDNEALCIQIPSADEFYGFSRGSNRLSKHLQWVYIPAVKDVTAEQNEGKSTALGKLLARTVRLKLNFDEVIRQLQEKTEAEYQTILEGNQSALAELETSLIEKLALWAHPAASVKLEWQKDSKKSVQIADPSARTIAGEGAFEGDLARFGHGFQRSYLLALLQVLAAAGGASSAPRLILGCEEPELYQHPPQARHLASVLEQLSQQDAQVIVCTHNPALVTGKGFESVRMIRFNTSAGASSSKQLRFEEVADRLAKLTGAKPIKPQGVAAKLHQELQPMLNELFFTKYLVLVEGLEDAAIITSWMVLSGRWLKFRQKGVHIVQVGGKSHLPHALTIAQGLGIPVFAIFDADGNDKNHKEAHEKDNKLILKLLGEDGSAPFPSATVWGKRHVVWPFNIGEAIKAEIPAEKMQIYENKANSTYGNPGGLQKNGLQIGTKLQLAFDDNFRPACLDKLCENILAVAEG